MAFLLEHLAIVIMNSFNGSSRWPPQAAVQQTKDAPLNRSG